MSRLSLCFCAMVMSGAWSLTHAAVVSVNVGQTVATTRTLAANGVPLRIKLVSLGTAEMRYLPSSIDNAKPSLTLTGMLEWFNLFGVTPRNLTGQTPAFNDSVLDPNFPPDDPFGNGNIRTAVRVRSSGTTIDFDNTSGILFGMGGFKHSEMEAGFMNNGLNGGQWRLDNLRYDLSTFFVTGNMSGTLAAIGTTPAQNIPAVTGATLWSFTGPTGPLNIPLASVASATSVANIVTALQNAGYTSVTTSATEVAFTGTYVMDDLTATTALKNHMCASLGCSKLARNALAATTNSFLGQFRTTVRISIPLTP